MIINVWCPLVSQEHFSLGFSRGALTGWVQGGKLRHGVALAIENGTPWTDLEGELPFSL